LVMKSNGDVKESSVHSFHGTSSTNHDDAGHTTAMLASSQPPAGSSSEFRCINNGDAVSPSASIDSDLTMETPQFFCRKDNHCIQSSSPPSKSKAAVVAKNATLPKRSPFGTTHLLPEFPALVHGTFEILGNTTRETSCEMCNAVHPNNQQMKEVEDVIQPNKNNSTSTQHW